MSEGPGSPSRISPPKPGTPIILIPSPTCWDVLPRVLVVSARSPAPCGLTRCEDVLLLPFTEAVVPMCVHCCETPRHKTINKPLMTRTAADGTWRMCPPLDIVTYNIVVQCHWALNSIALTSSEPVLGLLLRTSICLAVYKQTRDNLQPEIAIVETPTLQSVDKDSWGASPIPASQADNKADKH